MINKLIALIIISIIVVFFPAYAAQVMSRILQFHAMIIDNLVNIFSDANVGRMIRDFLGLIALPLIIGLVPVILYWIVKRKMFPYFMFVVWTTWLLQLGALIVLHKI